MGQRLREDIWPFHCLPYGIYLNLVSCSTVISFLLNYAEMEINTSIDKGLTVFVPRKNSKVQKRGKINLIGRLQLTTERMREEENEGIVQLRILRTQVWSQVSQAGVPLSNGALPLSSGGHHPDYEDEEAHQQRTAADGAGGDPEEHVFTTEEDDQGADWVAHRPQIHKAGREWHKHLHLHGVTARHHGTYWLWFQPKDAQILPGSRPLI